MTFNHGVPGSSPGGLTTWCKRSRDIFGARNAVSANERSTTFDHRPRANANGTAPAMRPRTALTMVVIISGVVVPSARNP
jgi:hypothetical protein